MKVLIYYLRNKEVWISIFISKAEAANANHTKVL